MTRRQVLIACAESPVALFGALFVFAAMASPGLPTLDRLLVAAIGVVFLLIAAFIETRRLFWAEFRQNRK